MIREKTVVFDALLICICIFLPQQLTFSIGSLALNPMKVLSIYLFLKYVRFVLRLGRTNKNINYVNVFVFLHCGWAILSMVSNHGLGSGVEAAGLYILEMLPFYFFGIAVSLSVNSLMKYIKYTVFTCFVLTFFGWYESMFSFNIISEVFGYPTLFYEMRAGLNRSFASFLNPILYGLFVSSFLGLAWYVTRSKVYLLFAVGLGALPPLSSAPVISLVIQGSLIAWRYIMRGKRYKWKLLAYLFIVPVLALELFTSKGAVGFVIDNFTYNPTTGYYRVWIWEYGIAQIERTPLFGIGYGDWIRPYYMSDSVDSFWLFTAMKFGVPSLIFLILTQYFIFRSLQVKVRSQVINNLRLGWVVSMIGIIFVGFTVHFWSSSFSGYSVFLGIGTGMSLLLRQTQQRERRGEIVNG